MKKLYLLFGIMMFANFLFSQKYMVLTMDGELKEENTENSKVLTIIPANTKVEILSGPENNAYYVVFGFAHGFVNELYFNKNNNIKNSKKDTASSSSQVPIDIIINKSNESINDFNNYKTEDEFKAYFKNNLNSLDPIEGIWNFIEVYQKGVWENKEVELPMYSLIIVKNGNKFKGYHFSEGKFYSVRTYYSTTIENTYIYEGSDPLYGNQKVYFVLQNDNFFEIITKNINPKEGYVFNFSKDTYVRTFPDIQAISGSNYNVKSTGTGFAISSNGYIITCNHVIESATSIKIKGVDENFNKSYSAKVISKDVNNDIAIIKIDDATFTTLGNIPYTIKTNTSDVGSNIFLLGYPLTATMGDEIKLTNGIISAKSGFKGDITSYQISAAAQPGNSGGPLFDSNGNLIGVLNAKHVEAENATYAVKSNYLINLIESLPTTPTLQRVNNLSGKALTEQVKLIKKFVYIIEVN